ncbi:MAG: hypothetical protein ACRDNW_06080 [Trebonia sp.]
MSHSSAVSMQELELESAELLPGRETLCVTSCHPCGGGFGLWQAGIGNTAQNGLVNVALLNGVLNNVNVGPIIL